MAHISRTLFGRGGRPPSEYLPFEEARAYVRRLGLSGHQEWRDWSKTCRPSFIPSNPSTVVQYRGQYSDMADWLGRERRPLSLRRRMLSEEWRNGSLLSSGLEREIAKSHAVHLVSITLQSSGFEIQSLPHQASASILYRDPAACNDALIPIKIRALNCRPNMGSLHYPSDIYPRQAGDFRGVHIVIADQPRGEKLYCFTNIEWSLSKVRGEDFHDRFEIKSVAELTVKLKAYYSSTLEKKTFTEWTPILVRKNLRTFSAAFHQLTQDVFTPLGMPAQHTAGAHHNVSVGNLNVMYRLGMYAEYYYAINVCRYRQDTRIALDRSDCLDCLIAPIRPPNQTGLETPIMGFFLMPFEYIKQLSNHCADSTSDGKVKLCIYPPFLNPKCRRAQETQSTQRSMYYSLATQEDRYQSLVRFAGDVRKLEMQKLWQSKARNESIESFQQLKLPALAGV